MRQVERESRKNDLRSVVTLLVTSLFFSFLLVLFRILPGEPLKENISSASKSKSKGSSLNALRLHRRAGFMLPVLFFFFFSVSQNPLGKKRNADFKT